MSKAFNSLQLRSRFVPKPQELKIEYSRRIKYVYVKEDKLFSEYSLKKEEPTFLKPFPKIPMESEKDPKEKTINPNSNQTQSLMLPDNANFQSKGDSFQPEIKTIIINPYPPITPMEIDEGKINSKTS